MPMTTITMNSATSTGGADTSGQCDAWAEIGREALAGNRDGMWRAWLAATAPVRERFRRAGGGATAYVSAR